MIRIKKDYSFCFVLQRECLLCVFNSDVLVSLLEFIFIFFFFALIYLSRSLFEYLFNMAQKSRIVQIQTKRQTQ